MNKKILKDLESTDIDNPMLSKKLLQKLLEQIIFFKSRKNTAGLMDIGITLDRWVSANRFKSITDGSYLINMRFKSFVVSVKNLIAMCGA